MFFLIPLAYFYGEERADSGDIDSDINDTFKQLGGALKKTVYYIRKSFQIIQ